MSALGPSHQIMKTINPSPAALTYLLTRRFSPLHCRSQDIVVTTADKAEDQRGMESTATQLWDIKARCHATREIPANRWSPGDNLHASDMELNLATAK